MVKADSGSGDVSHVTVAHNPTQPRLWPVRRPPTVVLTVLSASGSGTVVVASICEAEADEGIQGWWIEVDNVGLGLR